MEDLTIPVWFLVIFGLITGSLVPWAVWITVRSFNQDKDIAMNTQADTMVKEKIDEVKDDISEVKTDMTARIDKLENHFDAKFERVFKSIGDLKK